MFCEKPKLEEKQAFIHLQVLSLTPALWHATSQTDLAPPHNTDQIPSLMHIQAWRVPNKSRKPNQSLSDQNIKKHLYSTAIAYRKLLQSQQKNHSV